MLSKDEEMADRIDTMRNDADWQRQLKEAAKAPANTMHQHALAAANDTAGGRYAGVNPTTVVGSEPLVKYPHASTPFQRDPVPNEPPLGYAIDEMIPIENPTGVSSPPSPPVGTGGAEAPSDPGLSEHAAPPSSSEDEGNG